MPEKQKTPSIFSLAQGVYQPSLISLDPLFAVVSLRWSYQGKVGPGSAGIFMSYSREPVRWHASNTIRVHARPAFIQHTYLSVHHLSLRPGSLANPVRATVGFQDGSEACPAPYRGQSICVLCKRHSVYLYECAMLHDTCKLVTFYIACIFVMLQSDPNPFSWWVLKKAFSPARIPCILSFRRDTVAPLPSHFSWCCKFADKNM